MCWILVSTLRFSVNACVASFHLHELGVSTLRFSVNACVASFHSHELGVAVVLSFNLVHVSFSLANVLDCCVNIAPFSQCLCPCLAIVPEVCPHAGIGSCLLFPSFNLVHVSFSPANVLDCCVNIASLPSMHVSCPAIVPDTCVHIAIVHTSCISQWSFSLANVLDSCVNIAFCQLCSTSVLVSFSLANVLDFCVNIAFILIVSFAMHVSSCLAKVPDVCDHIAIVLYLIPYMACSLRLLRTFAGMHHFGSSCHLVVAFTRTPMFACYPPKE
jgi:hypothetical protein